MSSGGSQVTAATPWAPASPYLTDIMSQAKNLYGQQSGNYANPAANFGYGQATGAVGNAMGMNTPYGSMATSLAPNTTAAIQKQLSGVPDYGAVKQSLDAANQQTWDSFNNTELPKLNQNASFLGNPSGSIKDLNWATSQIGKNMDLNAQQQYLGEYDRSQAAQANAMGLGAGIAQGAGSQSLQGANLYPGIAQMPNQTLNDYASTISNTGGKFGVDTTSNKAGSGQTAANVIGGLTAGAGLLNTLTGTPVSSGVPAAWNALTGGGQIGASAGTMAGLGGDLAASTAAGEAGVAGDVAASNMAWLGAQPAAAGLGTGGAVAGADAAGAAAGSGAVGGSGAGALGGGASADGAAGAGLGAGAGAAAAIALPLAIAAAGYFQPAVQVSAAHNAALLKGLNAPPGSSEYNQASQQVIAQIASGDQDRRGLALPKEIQDKARQLGLFDSAAAMQRVASIANMQPGYAMARGKTSGLSRSKY